jgi:AcrR family transcriptional regulator
MARRIPENRFDELVRAATEVFIARGYRLTQMSDVAEAVGVAKGTLYGYVESKDALLWVCLVGADQVGPIPLPEVLPVPTLQQGQIGLQVKAALNAEGGQPILSDALKRDRAEDPIEEMGKVIGELYDLMFANRHRIKLLDRCMDHPELMNLWQTQGREQSRLAIARYVEKRIAAGQIRPVPNIRLAARIVIETVATWAVHIHWDKAPEVFGPEESRSNAIDFLVRGLRV